MASARSTPTPLASAALTRGESVTVVRVGSKRRVCYVFDTSASNHDLALRYRVTIDGKLMSTPGDSPRVLDAKSRKIDVLAAPGSKVALLLNSDVHPAFRRHPVYAVQVADNDVLVRIKERKGRIGHESAVLRPPNRQEGATPGKLVDVYDASLTGDIWMGISTLYTEEEADRMLADDTDATVRAAVRQIFRGLPANELVVRFPASDSAPGLTLRLRFGESDNVRENTCCCPLLTGVLPRTHPRTYAALLSEARAAYITELHVTSGWRPMLGSIVHRAGLGLDINYAESANGNVLINRAALTDPKAKRNDNVSEREQQLYVEYEEAKEVATEQTNAYSRAKKQLEINRDPKETERLQKIFDSAETQKNEAERRKIIAEKEWDKERDRHEHHLIRTLRGKLSHNKSVTQVLDPWYMDTNTRDNIPAVPNEHKSKNEVTHNNHLHVTIGDPKIL